MMMANNGDLVAFTVLMVPNAMKAEGQAASDQMLAEVHVVLKPLVALVCRL